MLELGITIDRLYNLRQERLALTKQVDELKQREVAEREKILDMLSTAGLAKASGQIATCGVKQTVVPIIHDWEQVYQYIKENDRFDLVQKRLSAPAWRELYDGSILVPGTEKGVETDISLTKSTR